MKEAPLVIRVIYSLFFAVLYVYVVVICVLAESLGYSQ